uniref:Uncharacterized protein n=1 Tax=Arundo donax TaxID=35708 RepID=A0A0A8YJS8_ARUDO
MSTTRHVMVSGKIPITMVIGTSWSEDNQFSTPPPGPKAPFLPGECECVTNHSSSGHVS